MTMGITLQWDIFLERLKSKGLSHNEAVCLMARTIANPNEYPVKRKTILKEWKPYENKLGTFDNFWDEAFHAYCLEQFIPPYGEREYKKWKNTSIKRKKEGGEHNG